MPNPKILYQSKEEIYGKHLRTKGWIEYSGKITVYDRKKNPVTLKIKSEIYDSFMRDLLDNEKEFKGNSVTEVYAKLSKWLYLREVVFQT
jgi:hypothetical protein